MATPLNFPHLSTPTSSLLTHVRQVKSKKNVIVTTARHLVELKLVNASQLWTGDLPSIDVLKNPSSLGNASKTTKPWWHAWTKQLRCAHCGLHVAETDRLPVMDPYDPRRKKAMACHQVDSDGQFRDYFRIPYTTFNLHAPQPVIEDSDFVLCSPPCQLAMMYDSPATGPKNLVPTRLHDYLYRRFHITEATLKAPLTRCLAYVQQQITVVAVAIPNPGNVMGAMIPVPALPDLMAKPVPPSSSLQNPQPSSSQENPRGILSITFLACIAGQQYQIRLASHMDYVPVVPGEIEEMEDAFRTSTLSSSTTTAAKPSVQSSGQPSVRPSVRKRIFTKLYELSQLPVDVQEHLPKTMIPVDANPDSDTETDYATRTVYPRLVLDPNTGPQEVVEKPENYDDEDD